MKKYLPLILLFVGLVVVVGVFLIVKNRNKTEVVADDEGSLAEVPLEKRPVVSLIPTGDGHYLKLKVEKIQIKADSMDYELLYQTQADITQGVPGTADIKGKDNFETELLMGTESSGKFRYDEGVENGSISLKFRDAKGKLVAKFETDFHMQTETTELTSSDGNFKYTPEEAPKGVFFVTMQTIGVPDFSFKAETAKDGYAVFSSNSN